jgi:hypothetical protein
LGKSFFKPKIMKSSLLAFALTFMLTLSLLAQEERYYDPIPKAIIGEWKVSKPKEDTKFETIIFYPSGLLNIDSKASKMVINYKVSERSDGYEVFISGMEHTSPFSSFFINPVSQDHMQLTLKNEKTFTLIKAKDIPFGIVPLQSKNHEFL